MNVGVSGTTHGRRDEIKRVNVKKDFPEDGASGKIVPISKKNRGLTKNLPPLPG